MKYTVDCFMLVQHDENAMIQDEGVFMYFILAEKRELIYSFSGITRVILSGG